MKRSKLEHPFTFQQIHIDAARNSTDDFNLFHDKNKWNRIHGNPFGGPIALGFQLECLIEYHMRHYRLRNNEDAIIDEHGLKFSNYQITFANVVKPGENIFLEIKKSQFKSGENTTLGNRVVVHGDQGIVLVGHKKESQSPLFSDDIDASTLPDLATVPDRSYLNHGMYFVKRKFMNTGNAKNFLSGSLAEQSDYFDELEEKVVFPETFPVSLVSCALLERAQKEKHDFERAPMAYTQHKISVDRECLKLLKSNDVLHLLIKQPTVIEGAKSLGKSSLAQHVYHCFGLVENGTVLFRSEIAMTPLEEIAKSLAHVSE